MDCTYGGTGVMGAYAGPDINEDGLVLALDAANYKSFKGEATTNVVGNAASMSGWSPYSYGNDGTFITEFGTTGYKMLNRGSWNGIYKGITLPATGTYTISAWFRYWGGASDNNGATVYTNGGGISDTAVALDKSKVGVWQRVSMTRTYSTTSLGFYLISYGGTAGASNSTWDVTMPQIEQKSYATTFTDATRGTTVATGGGWADLTGNGNNGQLVNGVRESADNLGSLSFDGSNDYLSTSLTGTFPQITFDYWGFFDDLTLNTKSRNESAFGDWTSLRVHWGTRWSVGMHWNVNNSWTETPATNLRYGWNHFSLIWNHTAGQKLIYINSILSTSGSTNGNMVLGDFRIGVATNLNAYYRGNISNFKVYNRALTANEVRRNFRANLGRFGI